MQETEPSTNQQAFFLTLPNASLSPLAALTLDRDGISEKLLVSWDWVVILKILTTIPRDQEENNSYEYLHLGK